MTTDRQPNLGDIVLFHTRGYGAETFAAIVTGTDRNCKRYDSSTSPFGTVPPVGDQTAPDEESDHDFVHLTVLPPAPAATAAMYNVQHGPRTDIRQGTWWTWPDED
jgi:hypothetical protein